MPDRPGGLSAVRVGDIIHGQTPGGASRICRVTGVDPHAIRARTVTAHEAFIFERETGVARAASGERICTIDSVAPLPPEIHAEMLKLERKFDPVNGSVENCKLTKAKIRALSFVARFFPTHPI